MGQPDPRPGDFFVIATKGWAADLIRVGTHSTVNHAGVFVGDGTIMEAASSGVIASPVSHANGGIWSTGHIPLTDAQRAAIVQYAKTAKGEPYGWMDIVALAASSEGVSEPWVWKYLSDQHTVICSQLVALSYAAAGIHLCPNKLPVQVTPGDLLDVLQGKAVPANYLVGA